jgi:hypothetical protein
MLTGHAEEGLLKSSLELLNDERRIINAKFFNEHAKPQKRKLKL